MKKFKKVMIAALAAMTMATGAMGITASAEPGTVTINSSSCTLTNTSGMARYGNVSFRVIDRKTNSQVDSASNGSILSNYASVTATISGYSAVKYTFKGSGTLFNGTNIQSGRYWNGQATY